MLGAIEGRSAGAIEGRSAGAIEGRSAGAVVLLLLVVAAAACGRSDQDVRDPTPAAGDEDVVRVAVGNGPCCIEATRDGIWVLNHRDFTLQHVDPKTNKVDETISSENTTMARAGERLLLRGEYRLELFDPQTRKAVPIDVVGANAGGVAFDGRALWIGMTNASELIKVDPESGRVLATVPIAGIRNTGELQITENGDLWAVTFDGLVARIDVRKKRAVAKMRPFPNATDYTAIAAAGGWIWAVSSQIPTLLRIDPKTLRVNKRRPITLTGNDAFPQISKQPDGTLWLVRGPGQLDELDPQTGTTVRTYELPLPEGHDLNSFWYGGVASGFGSVWAGIWSDLESEGTLVRLDR